MVWIQAVFLDILKAFEKVWHDCLIGKLQLVKSFLKNHKQRVVLNGKLHLGLMYWLVSDKDLYSASILISWFISMIYQITHPQILNYLLTIQLFFHLYVTKISQPGKDLNKNFQKTRIWAHQWKISFSLIPLSKHKR